MVQIKLSITMIGDGEAGVFTVTRVDGSEPKEMGKIKFNDSAEKRWLMMVLMEMHPYVTLDGQNSPDDPTLKNLFAPCCSH